MAPAPTLQELIDSVRHDAPGEDPLGQLSQASQTVAEMEDVADALLGHFVDRCRRGGRSWSEISAALGVSKQAAHKRFSSLHPTFERFTPRARAVLEGAAEEARSHRQSSVGSGHLLLALYGPAEGLAAQILTEAGVTRQACEAEIVAHLGNVSVSPVGPKEPIPFDSVAIEVLRGAVEEALRLGHNYIGTEHVLLALFREPDDPAAAALIKLGLTYDDAKARLTAKFAAMRQP